MGNLSHWDVMRSHWFTSTWWQNGEIACVFKWLLYFDRLMRCPSMCCKQTGKSVLHSSPHNNNPLHNSSSPQSATGAELQPSIFSASPPRKQSQDSISEGLPLCYVRSYDTLFVTGCAYTPVSHTNMTLYIYDLIHEPHDGSLWW